MHAGGPARASARPSAPSGPRRWWGIGPLALLQAFAALALSITGETLLRRLGEEHDLVGAVLSLAYFAVALLLLGALALTAAALVTVVLTLVLARRCRWPAVELVLGAAALLVGARGAFVLAQIAGT